MDKTLKESLINIFLVSFVFYIIISASYGINLYTFLAFIIFFLSLFLPLIFIRTKSKGEIKFIFIPYIVGKIKVKEVWEKDYYKKFPCWLVCSLTFSALTLFYIPIVFIGRLFFEGWLNPFKAYDSDEENSENELIASYLQIYIFLQILFSIFLMIINPLFGLIPALTVFYLIWPFPGNLGFDLYYMDFKKWLTTFFVTISYFIIYLAVLALYYGIKLAPKIKLDFFNF